MQKNIVRRSSPPQAEQALAAMWSPLLAKLYAARGISDPAQLNRQLSDLLSYHQLTNIESAANHLADAIIAEKKLMIVGDFDADGATSTTLSVLALKCFGAKYVDYLVPNRFEYGYGLTPEIVEVAKDKQPDLIITVDNGISSIAGVAHANQLGIDVIITDHHLPGRELPKALAIVNPNLNDDDFLSKSLAGVGVIFYVMSAVRRELQERGHFSRLQMPVPKMTQFLDLVALGTVADVVPLDHNNRILTYHGLQRIRAGKLRPGIAALLTVANRDLKTITASDLGFAIGPRLNAAGRLDDMSLGIECLLSEDLDRAHALANQLDELNRERKLIEQDMQQQAYAELEKLHLNTKNIPAALCLFDDTWHQGVIGILASRIKERYHRPVIAFAVVNDDEIKGSARSITGLHIRDCLDRVASQYPGLICKFGGHAMAAGLSIKRQDFPAFKQALEQTVSDMLTAEQLVAEIVTDGELPPAEMNLNLVQLLEQAGPWGQHFPEPTFDGVFLIVQQRIVGAKHLKLILSDEQRQYNFDAIMFNIDLDQWPNHRCLRARVVYRLAINEYKGLRKLQLMVDYMEALSEEAVGV